METASGGIKAPQYFAPGVAGDHGEPIAQFLQVDSFLFQNNLTANAHGNGYADPNFLITPTIGDVLVDSAGYNTRYGDHSIDLAVTYAVRDRLPRFLALSSDGRDGAVSAGWSPADDRKKLWVAGEALFGNGFLKRPEERQQYKLNALRAWQVGRHQLTAYGIADLRLLPHSPGSSRWMRPSSTTPSIHARPISPTPHSRCSPTIGNWPSEKRSSPAHTSAPIVSPCVRTSAMG